MSAQTACIWGCILTLIAFVGSFSTVRFQICPQISCPREGKITVAAFVWLSSTVGFQMSPQMACLWECKVVLVACVWLFSTVRFRMSPQTASHCSHSWHLFVFLHCVLPNVSSKRLHEKRQSHIGSICWTFLHCAFSNVSSKYLHKRMHTHIGCIYLVVSTVHFHIWASSVKLFPHSLHRKIPIAFQWLSTTDLNVKSSCHFSAPNCFECKIP